MSPPKKQIPKNGVTKNNSSKHKKKMSKEVAEWTQKPTIKKSFNTTKNVLNEDCERRPSYVHHTNIADHSVSHSGSPKKSDRSSIDSLRPKSLILLKKVSSEISRFENLKFAKQEEHPESTSNDIKTPLPTSTCSNRLNYAKSTLSFCKSSDRIMSAVQLNSVSCFILIE